MASESDEDCIFNIILNILMFKSLKRHIKYEVISVQLASLNKMAKIMISFLNSCHWLKPMLCCWAGRDAKTLSGDYQPRNVLFIGVSISLGQEKVFYSLMK